jgi:CHAD domain-containing protein
MLAHPPEEGARRLALHYLDQASVALPRIADDGDSEALHDLRVALRRLRSCLKSYGEVLGDSVPHKLERRLRRLAQATGPGRDAEVQIEWVVGQLADPAVRRGIRRAGQRWLLSRLEAKKAAAYGDLRGEMAAQFKPLAEEMRQRLSVYRAEIRLDGVGQPTFGALAAGLLRGHAASLEDRLGRIGGADDVEPAHAARISAKRLRYLTEPLVELVPRGAAGQASGQAEPAGHGALVRRIKALQELLGNLHDAHMMETELVAAVAEAATQRAGRLLELTLDDQTDDHALRAERRRPHEPGLLALARLNRQRRDQLFVQFAAAWRPREVKALVRATGQLADTLSQ